jgi:hypothetical protein
MNMHMMAGLDLPRGSPDDSSVFQHIVASHDFLERKFVAELNRISELHCLSLPRQHIRAISGLQVSERYGYVVRLVHYYVFFQFAHFLSPASPHRLSCTPGIILTDTMPVM